MEELQRSEKHLPKASGYHMPAEWEEHEATWLSWPHNTITWLNSQTNENLVKRIEDSYVQEIIALHKGEKINILVNNSDEKNYVKKKLEKVVDLQQIIFYKIPTVDVWIRDYGPIFLVNGDRSKLVMNHFIFDAWGRKYTPDTFPLEPVSWLVVDGKVPRKINEHLKIHSFEPGFVLEGGSIDVNGDEMLITTKQCLLRENYLGIKRNTHLSPEQIENTLKDYLGVSKILWLEEGIIGDDTDGHIDDLARFVSSNTILYVWENKLEDGNYQILKKNLEVLETALDVRGNKFELVSLPMPSFIENPNFNPERPETKRLPASYANFYIGNSAVIVPVFGDKSNDEKAVWIIQQFFPDRKTVPVYARDFVMGLGTFHCSTQQQPKIKK